MKAARPPKFTVLGSALRRWFHSDRFRFDAPAIPPGRQLLVDVSVIIRSDQRTGIQRAVRALLSQMLDMPHSALIVQPVFASRSHGYCKAALSATGVIDEERTASGALQPVVAQAGDVFLGLDLAANILPHVEADLARWRREGVAINIMVYDLLPILHPNWFQSRTVSNFHRWLGVLARQADRCICTSSAVARTLVPALAARGRWQPPDIQIIPLGADLSASAPSRGLPDDVGVLRAWLRSHRVALSVGTVEPRKGHDRLLAAFSQLWTEQPHSDLGLLIVGKPGWKTDGLQRQLRQHPENGLRLRWLDHASDELLSELYSTATGLIATSLGEGFGLPLIEALAQGTPVLARDLPVFQEIGGPLFDYFDDDEPSAFSVRLRTWMAEARRPAAESIACLPSWADSARALMHHLELAPA